MRAALVVLAIVVAGVVLTGASGDDGAEGGHYTVEFDNAFGVVPGGDLKVGGVRAGVVDSVSLDRETNRAAVAIELTEPGFESLSEDARCEIRMQSLLGEYYVECIPGRGAELAPGATIAVERTASTVPPDLVASVMRRPYRERLRLVIGELGAAVAGNGQNLNDALRRAVPALRETDRVLATLARQDRMLGRLVKDAETVVGEIAGNRRDVGRFVVESRDLAVTTAARGDDLAATLRTMPGLLREMAPTMDALRSVAARGRTPVRRLGANAEELDLLLERFAPWADATREVLGGVGRAAEKGRPAVRTARPAVAELENFSSGLPELVGNVRIILAHLNDRDNAIEADPRSPGGKGFTGLEAVLEYVLNQVLAINTYDGDHHLLKGAVPVNECSPYREPEQLTPDIERDCAIRLGPNGPGITTPDPTAPASSSGGGSARSLENRRRPDDPVPPRLVDVMSFDRQGTKQADRPTLPGLPREPAPVLEGAESLLDFLLGP